MRRLSLEIQSFAEDSEIRTDVLEIQVWDLIGDQDGESSEEEEMPQDIDSNSTVTEADLVRQVYKNIGFQERSLGSCGVCARDHEEFS